MKKIDFLKLALNENKPRNKDWVIASFALIKEDSSKKTNPLYPIKESWGYSFLNLNNEVEKIDDADPNEPLFKFTDKIIADNTFASNIKEPVETTVGNLIFNNICILSSLGNKFPFITGKVSVSKIEVKIAPLLQDTPKEGQSRLDTVIYVDEYVKFCDSLQFIAQFSKLCVHSATEKNIRKPEGIEQFKEQLLKKYEGSLTDPIQLAKFENELLEFDEKFLADDPSNNKFLSGKSKNIARKKLFLTTGAEQLKFDDSPELKPVIPSLNESWDTSPESYVAMMNGLRIGSFARGAETVKGGVAAKVILRATNNYRIVDNDCGTKLGIHRTVLEQDLKKYVNRYAYINGKLTLIKNINDLSNYLNKTLIFRSPMYCKSQGETICRVCAGENLAQIPEGLSIPLTEISSILLYASMKAMHGKKLALAKIDIETAFS